MTEFDKIIERKGTFCTQWDFVEDRFGQKDLLPFTISDTDFAITNISNQLSLLGIKNSLILRLRRTGFCIVQV